LLLALPIRSLGAFPGPCARPSSRGRLEPDPLPARFGKSNGNRLLGGTGAMLATTDVLHFLADELTGLSGRRLAFARLLPGAFDGSFFRHGSFSCNLRVRYHGTSMPLFSRPDGTLVRNQPAVRHFMPYLLRSRNESIVLQQTCYDLSRTRPWLEQYNAV